MERVVAVLCLLSVCSGKVTPPTWFDGECGKSKYDDAGERALPAQDTPSLLIVGGVDARPHEFPWQVSLRTVEEDKFFCGGSIINQDWVLTAAHCVATKGNFLWVVAGDHQRGDNSTSVRQRILARRTYQHEHFSWLTLENDIALVELTQPISFTEDIAPICPPNPEIDYIHRQSIVSGWGHLQFGGPILPDILQYATVNITTNQHCADIYEAKELAVTDDMICATYNAGDAEQGPCQGDSGGPLAVKDKDGTFSLVGIVSWGVGCASEFPGVYQRASYQAKWISETIAEM